MQLRSCCYLENISFVSVVSAYNAVMEFLCLFCAASVSALSQRRLWVVALDKAAWLTQSCVGVLSLRAYFIHSFGSFLPASFSVAFPFASVYLSVTWNKVSRRCSDLIRLLSLTCFCSGRNRVTGFQGGTRLA